MNWVRVELWWAMIFKAISHFLLQKTHLITGSSNITSSENLAEKTAAQQSTFEFPLYTTKYKPSGPLWKGSNSG